jgi:hypothetical protein
MANLAFVSEDKKCFFDVIHMGEDLTFLKDGYVYLTTHFIFEAGNKCEKFKTFELAYHSKVCNIGDSKYVNNSILKDDKIKIKKNKFVIYNESFLENKHPSNIGFEGADYKCIGRKISFDDYDNIYIPSDDEFDINLVDNYKSYALIRFEFHDEIVPGKRIGVRLGFLIEPVQGKKIRFFLYPPEIDHYFHFYTKKGLESDAIEYLNEMDYENRIMDIRLRSPKRKIITCDFFFLIQNEFIEGLLAPSRGSRMPFSKLEFPNDFLKYHLYPDEISNLVPIEKLVKVKNKDKEEFFRVKTLKFDNNGPLLLRIFRTDKAIFYSIIPIFLSILSITILYGNKLEISFIVSIILTIIVIFILNQIFTKTKIS